MKTKPLVTIYIPTYNRIDLLKRALKSAIDQSYNNIEILVVDDCSNDLTIEYLKGIAKIDSRVRYYTNEKNSGACISRNKAILQAKGEFITGLDDDDYLTKDHIKNFVTAWENKSNNCIALYPERYFKTTEGIKKSRKSLPSCSAKNLIQSNWIGNQVFTKTNHLKLIGGFDSDFPALQDLDCWFRLLSHQKLYAACTGLYSYVVDISHPHERISQKKIEIINLSFNKFQIKHKLTETEINIINCQKYYYGIDEITTSAILKKIIFLPSYRNTVQSLKLYTLHLISKITS